MMYNSYRILILKFFFLGVCIILNAIFTDFMEGNLTYKAWVPFDYTLPIILLLIFTHQMIIMSICAAVNVACDSLITTGLLQEIFFAIVYVTTIVYIVFETTLLFQKFTM
ncbi:hypothetical protein ALC57_05226 [Trachymyrmex cornetzi]|uniref:Uncharacterized protein n=1 Tax=Trachymyrmex cornetzi TaxID=471704 RepID=A0A151JB87_9HYME|nr:hypothetical protein ALC57_05226 [Trachymyrmex cornetzi]